MLLQFALLKCGKIIQAMMLLYDFLVDERQGQPHNDFDRRHFVGFNVLNFLAATGCSLHAEMVVGLLWHVLHHVCSRRRSESINLFDPELRFSFCGTSRSAVLLQQVPPPLL